MREIKFRAWDKELKKMVYKDFWDRNWYGTPKNDEGGCHTMYSLNEIKFYCEVMQYTGLKDKNGKEIYEGDIIQKLYKGKPQYSFPSYIIIEWGFHSDHSSYMYQLGWNLWEDEEYKVVGNIYEHKHLLK